MLSKPAYIPGGSIFYNTYLGNPADTYNVNAPFLGYGASNYFNNASCNVSTQYIQSNQDYPNWLSPVNNNVDMRAAYVYCCNNTASNNYCSQFEAQWPDYDDVVHSISPVTKVEVAYTA